MNITDEALLTRPGVAAICGDYPMWPSEYSEIFETFSSDKAVEYEAEMRFTGLGQYRPEGAPTAVDDMGQRVVTQYNHRYFALAFNITRMALVNNLYQSKFPLQLRALKKSMHQTKEVSGASVFNNATNAAFPLGDGQTLLSVNHPIDGGVYPNTPAAFTALSEAALETGTIQVGIWPDWAGLIVATKPVKLLVPPQGVYTAQRLLQSQFRVGVNTNDINAMYNMSVFPKGCVVNHYLTSPTAWFILTDADNGFKHYEREPFETDVYCDFSTDSLMVKAVECYSFGATNPRAVYGSSP